MRHEKRHGRTVTAYNGNRAVPPLPEGKIRCPACLSPVTPTKTGRVRAHTAPNGDPCAWRGQRNDIVLDELPEVHLPPGPRTSPQHATTTHTPARTSRPAKEPSRLDAGTLCENCGKWLPGERRLCGQCYVRRTSRR